MKRSIVGLAALLVLAALPACGGQTGLEVRIEPSNGMVAGREFNSIRVSVSDIDGDARGEAYPVTELTEKPYRVFVLAGYETKGTVKIHVQLLKDGAVFKEEIKPSVKFEDGEIKPVVFAF